MRYLENGGSMNLCNKILFILPTYYFAENYLLKKFIILYLDNNKVSKLNQLIICTKYRSLKITKLISLAKKKQKSTL